MKPEYIIIHHSWTEDGIALDTPAIKRYHTEVMGWADVGYHYLIEKVGGEVVITKGRMDTQVGAHCRGFNDRSLGICMVGNFDREEPSGDMLEMLIRLVLSLQEIYNIPSAKVIGHRETYMLLGKPVEKTCPGEKFDMDKVRTFMV